MSTREQVMNNVFFYICVYLKNNGETCNRCCPNTSFTFDNTTDTPPIFIIHTWNFNTPQPTIENLMEIPYNDVVIAKKLRYIEKSQALKALVISTNQIRTQLNLSSMTDSEKAALVEDGMIIF